MLNNLYHIGSSALNNAQVSVQTVSNNIANSDTEGYRRNVTVYESTCYLDVGRVSVGSGAAVIEVQSQVNWFVEEQYLDTLSEFGTQEALYEYLAQAEALLNQSENNGLASLLDSFWDSWNTLAEDPTSVAAREELLGVADTLVYELNYAREQLDDTVQEIDDELRQQVSEVNSIVQRIAILNKQVVSSQDNYDLLNTRDLLVKKLGELVDITVDVTDTEQVDVTLKCGYSLVDGAEYNELVYSPAREPKYISAPGSTWSGQPYYAFDDDETPSEEILLEFVTAGSNGTAEFKVSFDGGTTWETDEDGNELHFTASDPSNPAVIKKVEIGFVDTSGNHAVGDRVSIVPKTGVYWTPDEGEGLYNITTLTNESGENVGNRIEEGSIAGLLMARDDNIQPFINNLNELASTLIWEINLLHSQGASSKHQTLLEGSYTAEDTSVIFENSDLAYADKVTAGHISFVTYDSDGDIATQASVSFDPASDSIEDLKDAIKKDFGTELEATINSDNSFTLAAGNNFTFEIAEDTTGVLAALGLNTFFSGSTARSIAVNSALSSDSSRVNCQVVETDGTVSSGSNDTASAISNLSTKDVTIGEGADDDTLSGYLGEIIAKIGSASAATELQKTYTETSVTYYKELISSISGVNIDEETLNLTKYQQQYEAAARIVTTAQSLWETILNMA